MKTTNKATKAVKIVVYVGGRLVEITADTKAQARAAARALAARSGLRVSVVA